MIEPSADVAPSARVADNARVWHLAQVREDASIGEETIVGRGAYIGEGVRVGDRCKIQNYALIYEPASLADGVFVGPAAVFTNDHAPRAINPDGSLKSASDWDRVGVTVERGGAIGARAVCVAPVRIGAWASVGAGAVVTRDVAPYALVVGVPARRVGWVGEAGVPLVAADDTTGEAGDRTWLCPATGRRYVERDDTLSPEESQASSPHDVEMPDQTPEDQP
ncbi:acyltransferase [uncultured Actinomyces sp.]|uniref:acyltransferase n=1 Tax=uncultured Actinomyces sp. TaxID=249061 RepID=UPI002627D93E|nr:acyltransferase [uncultured Actinomyces sp.]